MEIPQDAARQLVGPRADYYLKRWAHLKENGHALGFNWPAFFMAPFWMLYRRMYRACLLLVVAALVYGILEAALLASVGMDDVPPPFRTFINTAIAVICGRFSSYWYYLEARRRYRVQAASGALTPEQLAAAGGTSWRAAAVGVGVAVGLLLAAAYAGAPPAT